MTIISWLHLSDMHINAKDSEDQTIILNNLIIDIYDQLKTYKIKLNFIFITGDVAFSASQEDYKIAIKFFNDLCGKINFDNRNLFIIPGNHDVNRDKVSKPLDDSRNAFEFRNEIRNNVNNKKLLEKYLSRFDNYSKFITGLYGTKYKMTSENYFLSEIRKIDNIKIGIVGLNSVWTSYGGRNDSNNIYISEQQLINALENVKGTSIKIVMVHHPISWLYEVDKIDIENLLFRHVQIILHGHLHRSDFQLINSIKGQEIVIPAGAIYTGTDRRFSNVFNITTLDFTTNKVRIIPRRYYDSLNKFLKDIETIGNDNDNYYEINIPQNILSRIHS